MGDWRHSGNLAVQTGSGWHDGSMSETQPLDFNDLPDDVMQETAEMFYQEIRTRRTVRDFSSKAIPEGVLEHCLMAAGTAPSGANLQPWHFAVVRGVEVKKQIREAAEEEERAF